VFNYVHYLKRLSDFDFVRKNIAVLLFFIVLAPYHNSFLPDTIRKANSDFTSYINPNGAMEQNFNMTKSPETGYPPSELRMVAFKRAMAIIESRSGDFTTLQSQWTERGPVNVGGRTRALMFDPNDIDNKKVWAGGVAGGIWSIDDITDPTAEWSAVDDFMANLAVTTLAYDPTNPTTFYAGTGEGWSNFDAVRGDGIFVSNNSGSTWTQLTGTADLFYYVQKIVVTESGTILAAVKGRFLNDSGIYRSLDQGTTWQKVQSGLGADIEVGSDGFIMASLGIVNNPGSIYRSEDEGKTWVAISGVPPSSERIELAIAPSNPSIIYATASNEGDITWLAKSVNAGSSWTTFAIPTTIGQDCEPSTEDFGGNQAWYNLILAVHPTNPDKILVGGISLYSSENGGQSWEQISYWTGFCLTYVHADQHAIQFRPGNPDEAIFGNDGGVFYSVDVGSTTTPSFVQRNNGYNVTQFYSLALENQPQSNYMLAGTQDNGTQRFDSGGLNNTVEVTGGDGGFCFIDSDLSLIQITSYIYNKYYLSLDGGENFGIILEDTDEGLFINPADYDDYLDILYAAGNTNQVNIYSDLATSPTKETYSSLSLGQVTHIKASENVIGRIFLGTENSGIFRIDNMHTDSPDIFSIRGDLPGTNYVSSIAIGESDDHLLITFSNYDVTHVYETKDGGANWVAKDGDLPNIPVRWSQFNPADLKEIFLATEVGIWTTTDISVTNPVWVPDNLGLANVRTDMIKLRRADGLAGVATHGRGVFTTTMVSQSIADFTVGDPISYIDNEISFYDLSYNAGNSWGWEFGDDLTSSGLSNTTHSYDEAGVYDINLTVGAGEDDKLVPAAVHILPDLNGTYLLSDGGDFESNADHFATLSVSGSSFERGNSTQTGKNETVSGQNAWVLAPNNATHLSNTRAFLYTPSFNFTNPGTYSMEFSTKYDLETTPDGAYDGFFY